MLAGDYQGQQGRPVPDLRGRGQVLQGRHDRRRTVRAGRRGLPHLRLVRRSVHRQLHGLRHGDPGSRPARRRHHPGAVLGPADPGPQDGRGGRGGGAQGLDRAPLPDRGQPPQRAGRRRGAGLLHQHGAAPAWPSPTRLGSSSSLETFNEVADRTPNLVKLAPSGTSTWKTCTGPAASWPCMNRLGEAGLVDGSVPTIAGVDMADAVQGGRRCATTRSSGRSTGPTAPPAVWPCCSATSRPGAPWSRNRRSCPRCWCTGARPWSSTTSRRSWTPSRQAGSVPGSVVVIRYVGPKGGPGMPEMLTPTSALAGAGLDRQRGAHHRRPLQRRQPGSEHRPRGARGARRRPHRARPGRGHDQHRHPRADADPRGRRRRDGTEENGVAAPGSRAIRACCAAT